MVGHRLWKASEVYSDQILPVYIAKHDTLDTTKVMGHGWCVSIALGILVSTRAAPRGVFQNRNF